LQGEKWKFGSQNIYNISFPILKVANGRREREMAGHNNAFGIE